MNKEYKFKRPYGDFTPLDALSLDDGRFILRMVKKGELTPEEVCRKYRVNHEEYEAATARIRARHLDKCEWEEKKEAHDKAVYAAHKKYRDWVNAVQNRTPAEPLSEEEENLRNSKPVGEWQDRPWPVRFSLPNLPEGCVFEEEEAGNKKEKESPVSPKNSNKQR